MEARILAAQGRVCYYPVFIPVRRTNYDAIASEYDRRYAEDDYSGVATALNAFLSSGTPQRAVEIGCGTGHWLQGQPAPCSMIGLDRSRGMLRIAHHAGARVCRGEAERLPFRDKQFDRVFCINAFHHFSDQPRVIAEVHRVLAHGGTFMTIALDPHRDIDHWWVYDYFDGALANDRQRYPSTQQIVSWLNDVGFVECRDAEVQHLPADIEVAEAFRTDALAKAQTSQLSQLTDAEYSAGIAKVLAAKVAADTRGEQLRLYADLRLFATYGRKAS